MLRWLQFGLTLALCVILQGCLFVQNPLGLPPADFQEVVVRGGSSAQKILMLDIDGVITSGAGEGSPLFGTEQSTVNQVSEKLAKARRDEDIKAVILRVDSPGGGVTASDIIYERLRKFKKDTGLPVYVSMLDLAASGGYYVSMAGDEIYVHPTTITGSIGVIAMFPQFEGLGKKIGAYMEILKSGENKDLTGGFKNMTDGQRAILQQMIDEMYARFVSVVKDGRPNLEESKIRELADGRIYTAQQAVDNGLVDGIKYTDEVVDLVREKIGNSKARVIMYRKTATQKYDSVYARMPNPAPQVESPAPGNVNLLNIDANALFPQGRPVFNYLWVP
ncbi:signal peptide peptidase SppA [Candidatus Sumerlaeota bacterium]|nr:signal peptide peptidase SppA [Candidatus Sumerlaeota bacterium]